LKLIARTFLWQKNYNRRLFYRDFLFTASTVCAVLILCRSISYKHISIYSTICSGIDQVLLSAMYFAGPAAGDVCRLLANGLGTAKYRYRRDDKIRRKKPSMSH